MKHVYTEFALLLLASAGAGFLALRMRQPLLIAYIAVGIIAGPAVLGWVTAYDQVDLLAQIGVTVLLFVVGLKLDLHNVRRIGPVALSTGLGQLSFTIIIGFALLLVLGKDMVTALYVAVALTFSSTIIIVKLLSDKKELDSLHGRIAVGFLIVQDIAVVLAMMVMSALRGAEGNTSAWEMALSLLLRIGIAGMLLFLLMRYVLSRLLDRIARSSELLLIFAMAWGTAFAVLGEWAGFSKEAGAFLAGFSLASTGYREVIGSRLASMRDFLLLFFFLGLGRYGRRLFRQLHAAGLDVLGVDFDPEVTLALEREGMHVHFGDCEDMNFLDTLPLDNTKWVVSTLPQPESQQLLLSGLKHRGYGGRVAAVARDDTHMAVLKATATDKILYPFNDAADFAAEELVELLGQRRASV